ncbi:phage tail protein [Neisseria uirgultaei]|uniref:phage tail protein n=1 Tax=Neisseria uirgultaei TaxID=2830646 RepID=UPI00272C223F|nr:phage tail protein [Neisseria uirgultaei]
MANAVEQNQFDREVRLLEPGDKVVGGVAAPINQPLQALANRTIWLKKQTEDLQTATEGKAASATAVNAGNGLTGGGNLTTSRTISLGQPGKITAQSQNAVQEASHTHAIDTATTTRAGIVQLESSTGSEAEDLAATPKAVKVAYDKAVEAINAARAVSIPTATTSRAGIVQLAAAVSGEAADAGKIPTVAAVNSAITTLQGGTVALTGEQTITGAKTFQADIKASASTAHAAADRYIRLGADATGAYAVNSKSNKVLYLRHDGNLTYDGNRVLTEADAPSLITSSAVMYFARTTAPDGWLKANGAAVSRTAYAALFAAIGTTYGTGDGRTTFNLPDLRGEFVRGWDDSRGIDSGRALGSAQGDAIRNITGKIDSGKNGALQLFDYIEPTGAFGVEKSWKQWTSEGNGGNDNIPRAITFDASSVVPTAPENRPRNIALLACIKI